MEVDGDLLLVEHVVKQEEIVHGHERYGVDEAASVQERFEVVVLLVLLYVVFKFVDVKVALSMPVLVLEIVHVCKGVFPCEAAVQVEIGCLKGAVVDDWEDVRVRNSRVNYLLPHTAISVLGEEEIVDSVEESRVVQARRDLIELLFKSLVKLGVADCTHPVSIHQMSGVPIRYTLKVLQDCRLELEEGLVSAAHSILLTVSEGAQQVRYVINVELALLVEVEGALLYTPEDALKVLGLQDV